MSRLADTFSRAREGGRAALVAFVTAGDPSPAATPALVDAIVAAGADIVEIGMPFTDPMADGPAIQAANLRALAAGTRTRDVLAIARAVRDRHPALPIVLMGYANPMLIRGAEAFARDAADAGVDGVICVDVPPEEDAVLGPPLRAAALDLVRLATPTTDAARLPAVLAGASGFVYYVSVAGVTGQQQAASGSIDGAVSAIHAATDLPVAVGFGVRTPEQAAAVARVADGVVVGSAIVEANATGGSDEAARLVAAIAAAVRDARIGVTA